MTKKRYVIGIDEVGRAAQKRASLARHSFVIGLDEVGRGSLAGPVTVATAMFNSKRFDLLKLKSNIRRSNLPKLKDSKKLTPKQRGIWFEYIKNNPQISYTLASVSSKVVDRINISKAANLAATRAFKKLTKKCKLTTKNCRVFLDGGLYVEKLKVKNSRQRRGSPQAAKLKIKDFKTKTIIRGDEKIPAIMLASIVAKVSRDRLMTKLHKKYPRYGFAQHKGYGTKKHIKAIKKYGLSPMHRRSFKFKQADN